ncbi:MAG: S-methyl-5-thioribose-1-phosphate isomerase, partial [Cyanobacteria bacterium]|nr:S-methyl-5-thioribose-1-phosphate isomerase [Cyanobacteriota bacterium]
QNRSESLDFEALKRKFAQDIEILRATRPTAVNLGWALDQLLALIPLAESPSTLLDQVTAKAQAILAEDLAGNYQMGEFGKTFFPKGARVLTHCNAGALATAGYGTALGVIRSAFAQDPTVTVYADETRPRLQGARLTTWELIQDGIPVTLITDGMSGLLMKSGKVDLVIVGADRIAANGDTANKIGTYNLAIVAKAHGVPFYVAAPTSTFDLALPDGTHIPIEERHGDEIAWTGSQQHPEERLCAQGTQFYNPSFDVTPADYITAIITERGIARPPFQQNISQLF